MFYRLFSRSLAPVLLLSVLVACTTDPNRRALPTGYEQDVPQGVSVNQQDRYNAGYGFGTGQVQAGNLQSLSQQDVQLFGTQVPDRIYFRFNSASLTEKAQRTLQQQAEWLRQFRDYNLIVEGHCDERGTREYNLALGERRANAVRDYLINVGVPSSRIVTTSYGKERPEYLESNEVAWSKNRRAVTVVQVGR